ncbi:unnamed protein product [Moneuplotes crassus]|uniref:Uncharacterized protein n=1 Tax=Euplotes crassus TaxID=5936 RepID=A0AAD1Y2J5_EUPCR|nr:unnamed protein product [Moneuplotes crassus]
MSKSQSGGEKENHNDQSVEKSEEEKGNSWNMNFIINECIRSLVQVCDDKHKEQMLKLKNIRETLINKKKECEVYKLFEDFRTVFEDEIKRSKSSTLKRTPLKTANHPTSSSNPP